MIKWWNKYYQPLQTVSIAPLIVFRIIFGALMLFGTIRFLLMGWVESMYIQPDFFFPYLGFEWVKPLPGNWMYLPFVLMLISSIGIMLGFFYRISASIFFLAFSYVELLDKTNYLNHYYFICLVAFLLIFLPANKRFSLDVKFGIAKTSNAAARWQIDMIKFQLATVYIFAGIAKINSDWLLRAEPLKTWLQAHHNLPLVGDLMSEKWLAYLFSWTGCFYDLFIVFFLIWNRSRPFAYAAVIFFHLITWYLFPIGVFPWVMICCTSIFFAPTWHEKLLNKFTSLKNWHLDQAERSSRKWVAFLISSYIVIQVLVPFRYVLYPGHLFWNEEGFRFSWRVMLMHKEGYARFFVRDAVTGRELEVNNCAFLTPQQEDQMSTQPDMILQYADILANYYRGRKLQFGDSTAVIGQPEVFAEIYVSLNGRPSQLFVSKDTELSNLDYNLFHREWIEPFRP